MSLQVRVWLFRIGVLFRTFEEARVSHLIYKEQNKWIPNILELTRLYQSL